tara:strand:+ start:2859 stop:3335 length:477 start_codon:yes stop_codon:yes gene_type:complete
MNPFVAAGIGLSLLGARSQARNIERVAGFNAAISDRNARAAQQAAEQERFFGQLDQVDFRAEYKKLAARQQTALVKSGFDPDSGTALQIKLASAKNADRALAQIGINAARRASDQNERALNSTLRSQVTRLEAKAQAQNIRVGAIVKAGKTVAASYQS